MSRRNRKHVLTLTKKDFKVTYYRASGAGGQHRNKTDSAVRITHIETGAQEYCETHRQQGKNKAEALKKFKNNPKFMAWIKTECEIDRALEEGDILFEGKSEEGKWVEIPQR